MFAAAVQAVDPARAVASQLAFARGALAVGEVRLDVFGGVHLIAIGKAAVAMAQGALAVLNGAIVSGDVITKDGHVSGDLPARIRVHEAGHPIPDERGVRATRKALDALSGLDANVVVLALISGGGSALLEAPRDGTTLEDLARTTQILLRAGAPIDALNAVRAPLSLVKAGGLRAAAPAARWVTLILSDVLGNDPRIIASGPTAPGRNDPSLALEIIDRYGVRGDVPQSVIAALEAGRAEPRGLTANQDVLRIIGDNATAVAAAESAAQTLGLQAQVVWTAVEGEAAKLGREWVRAAAEAQPSTDVLLGGGEATVTVRGDGDGGRNTEFALAAAIELERRGMIDWVVASLATDGQDALTGLAGAMADAGTCQRSRDQGADPLLALANNDSLAVFSAAGGAVETGPTGTNVNDLYVAVRTARPDRAKED
jgi:hydroxypyruvate reductase